MTPTLSRRTLLIAFGAAMIAAPASAAKPPVFSSGDAAINGYDPVAYFNMNKPVKGDAKFASSYNGANFLFSSSSNKTAFDADPEAFAPQYGGYCAYAVSKGATAPTVPEAFTIVDGKLYLNFSTQVMGIWRGDIPGNIKRANANWPKVLDK